MSSDLLLHAGFVASYGLKAWHVPRVNMVEEFSTAVVVFDPEEGITNVRIMRTGTCMRG